MINEILEFKNLRPETPLGIVKSKAKYGCGRR